MASREKKPRRRLFVVLGVVATIIVYGLAVERTGVSLDEITSETRQNQLVRIVRALAQPDLVTYDFEQELTDIEFFIPCQGDRSPVTTGGVTVSPGCGDPENIVTVSGSGFEPGAEGRVRFIPESDFDVSIPLTAFTADRDGRFSVEVELPDRPSGVAQILQVSEPRRLGTWGERQEVWTDTNENGVLDLGVIGTDGLEVVVEGVRPEILAAALLDPTNQVTEYVTTGEPVLASAGPARGAIASPLGESAEAITISELRATATGVAVVINGPEGTDVSAWRVAIYDGAVGESLGTEPLGDQIELSPRISQQTNLTIDKIIDTVFLALVATTAGLIVALPLSFIAARNLMKDVSTTVVGLGLGLIAIPIGLAIGFLYLDLQRTLLADLTSQNLFRILLLLIGGSITYTLARQIFFGTENANVWRRTARSLVTMVALAVTLDSLYALLIDAGDALRDPFGPFHFVPGLFVTLGDVGAVVLPFLIALIGASITLGIARQSAFWINARESLATRTFTGYAAMAVGGAAVAGLIGLGIDWLYQIANPAITVVIPALVGAALGIWVADVGRRKGEIKIGLSIYYIARTVFNTLRSIEPLVMVIVFVVWVGFGEFAGSLALALHTSAALAKLYSEQVESISEGPLEAIRATGANRLQTIIYAVVPQIVPPYISFTMYRWDINVRMSTILGFAGGGGIGFLLQQNVQLGDYRAAAVQMLAIAIVVASMDYASSRLRERFV